MDATRPGGSRAGGPLRRPPSADLPPGALAFLKQRIEEPPELLLVLGSGLSGLAEGVEDPSFIRFSEVPGFPVAGVEGHAGRWVVGAIGGRRILIQAGRFHYYEGYSSELVVAPIRLAALLGVSVVILTNAAGGIAPALGPGSLLLLDDHQNHQWRNPLRGSVRDGEGRLPDLRAPYDPELQTLAEEVALRMGIPLSRGTYAAVLGPSYETPAEVRYLRRLGADAVGMSTVPEAITASALGLRVVAFSLITNRAAGLGVGSLDHEEVLRVGRDAGRTLETLLRAFISEIPRSEA
jgi:purine-nucleoside phosphorylase